MGRRRDASDSEGSGSGESAAGGSVSSASRGKADDGKDTNWHPRFDPNQNVRFRHEIAVMIAVGMVALLDFLVAGVMSYEHFGNPSAVWGIAVAISLIEGLYTVVTIALIEFHVGSTKHWDLVVPLTFIWTGSLAVNVVFCLGAVEEKATYPDLFAILVALIVASQGAGLALALVGSRLHILYLYDPHPEKHGYHARRHHDDGEGGHRRKRKHRGSRWRRRHEKKDEGPSEDSARESG